VRKRKSLQIPDLPLYKSIVFHPCFANTIIGLVCVADSRHRRSSWSWRLLGGASTYLLPDIAFGGDEKILESLPSNPTALDFSAYILQMT